MDSVTGIVVGLLLLSLCNLARFLRSVVPKAESQPKGNGGTPPHFFWDKLLPGVSFVTLIGLAFWFGGELRGINKDIKNLQDNVGILLTEVLTGENSLKIRVTRIDSGIGQLQKDVAEIKADLSRLAPRVIREDFDQAITKLNSDISRLNGLQQALQRQLAGQQQKYGDLVKRLNDSLVTLQARHRSLLQSVNGLRAGQSVKDPETGVVRYVVMERALTSIEDNLKQLQKDLDSLQRMSQ